MILHGGYLKNKSIKTEAFECYSYSLVLVFLLLPRFKKITRLIGLNKLNLDSKKIIFWFFNYFDIKKIFRDKWLVLLFLRKEFLRC